MTAEEIRVRERIQDLQAMTAPGHGRDALTLLDIYDEIAEWRAILRDIKMEQTLKDLNDKNKPIVWNGINVK